MLGLPFWTTMRLVWHLDFRIAIVRENLVVIITASACDYKLSSLLQRKISLLVFESRHPIFQK